MKQPRFVREKWTDGEKVKWKNFARVRISAFVGTRGGRVRLRGEGV